MPELPEVEIVCRALCDNLIDNIIIDIQKFRKNLRYDFPQFVDISLGKTKILAIGRRAKYLIFELSNGYSIISHLGMSGSWNLNRAIALKHDHFVMTLKDQAHNEHIVIYNDPRRFGFILYEKTSTLGHNKFLSNLGLEPLSQELDGKALYKKIANKNVSFKTALLDQTIIAGLGNIYVCEALWRSNISPFTKVNDFCKFVKNSEQKLQNLCNNIKEILNEALLAGGSSFKDYKHIDGSSGSFQRSFATYGRFNEPCPKCSNAINRDRQNGRSSFFCETCQPLLSKET